MNRRSTNIAREARSWDILVVDIVGYSEKSETEQVKIIERLTAVVRGTEVLKRTASTERIFLPTGDGMIVGFTAFPERPLELAREIHEAYGEDRYELKIGIHSGIAFNIRDIRGQVNIAGSGINLAQRVVSCCSPGHILVAQDPGDKFKRIDRWEGSLHGPFEFLVKHNRPLWAYNFFDSSGRVGNSVEPSVQRVFPIDQELLRERLAKVGVVSADPLRDRSLQATLGNPLMIDFTILDGAVAGFVGVPAEQLAVRWTSEPPPLPHYAYKAKSALPAPIPNRPKVYLSKWVPPISDQGNILELTLGPTDYWTSRAIQQEECLKRLHDEVAGGSLHLASLPLQLNCHIVVLTADDRLVLCRRSATVRYEQLSWSASIGESIDTKIDVDRSGTASPVLTVRRALGEELGVPEDGQNEAEIRFVAVGTEWHYLLSILFAVVRLRRIGSRKLGELMWLVAGDQGEHIEYDTVEFTPQSCLPIVIAGSYYSERAREREARLYGTSRLGILAALFSEFGYAEVFQRIVL